MPITLSSMRDADVSQPPTLLVYGVHGIGKTELGAGAPNPVFIQTEDGLRNQRLSHVKTFGLLKAFSDIEEAIGVLASEDHDRKTVVVDSIDWLEKAVWAEACVRNGWASISTPDYGRGYDAALDVWRYILDGFTTLRNDRGMAIIFLAHASIRRFSSPESEAYDTYAPKLHESGKGIGANPLIQEYVDCLLFYNYRVAVLKDKVQGSKDTRARAVGDGSRVIYTERRPAFSAKNRFSMPAAIGVPDDPALAWPTLAAHIPFYSAQ